MSGYALKLIAVASMLIDHIGLVLFPDIIVFRCIGRIAYPIFAYLIVEGFIHTSNLKKYIARIVIFGFISEIPFNLMLTGKLMDFRYQNVFFTFAIGLVMLYFVKQNTVMILNNAFLVMGILFAVILRTDYSIYGIGLIYIFYVFKYDKRIMFCLSTLVSLISGGAQSFAALATVILFFYNGERGSYAKNNKYMKYLFYVFYPLHILVLVYLKCLIYS